MSRNDLKKTVVFSNSMRKLLLETAIQEESFMSGKTQSAELENALMKALFPTNNQYLFESMCRLYSERGDVQNCLRGIFLRISSDPNFMVNENLAFVKIARDLMLDKVMDWKHYSEMDSMRSSTPYRFLKRTLEAIIDDLSNDLQMIDAKLYVNNLIYDSKVCEKNNKVFNLISSPELHKKDTLTAAIIQISDMVDDLENEDYLSWNFESNFFFWIINLWDFLCSHISVYTILADIQYFYEVDSCDQIVRNKIRNAALLADKCWK